MKLVAVTAVTGGAGVTATVANLAQALARARHQVVALDLDPCEALGLHLGLLPEADDDVVAPRRLRPAAQRWGHENVGVRACAVAAEAGLKGEALVSAALEDLEAGDEAIVLMDCGRWPAPLSEPAMARADLCLLVLPPEVGAYAALPRVRSLLKGRRGGVVVNRADPSRTLARDVLALLEHDLDDALLGVVHADLAVSEALARRQTLADYDRYGQALRDYELCAQNLLSRLRDAEAARR